MFFGGILSIFSGYYFLSKGEKSIYSEALKNFRNKKVNIISYKNEEYSGIFKGLTEKDRKIYIVIDGKKIPINRIRSIDNLNINEYVIKTMSKNGTIGIILAAFGGFSVILSLILKDFL